MDSWDGANLNCLRVSWIVTWSLCNNWSVFVGRLRCLKVFSDPVPGGLRGRLVYLKAIVKRGGEGGGVKGGMEGRQTVWLSLSICNERECGGRRLQTDTRPVLDASVCLSAPNERVKKHTRPPIFILATILSKLRCFLCICRAEFVIIESRRLPLWESVCVCSSPCRCRFSSAVLTG